MRTHFQEVPGAKAYHLRVSPHADGRLSKPSPVHAEITVDNFQQKLT